MTEPADGLEGGIEGGPARGIVDEVEPRARRRARDISLDRLVVVIDEARAEPLDI